MVSGGNPSLRQPFFSIAACGNKVDPVYETLRFGTSLAQRTKKGSSGSGSESPHRTSVIILFLPQSTCSALGRADPRHSSARGHKCIMRTGLWESGSLWREIPGALGHLRLTSCLWPTPRDHCTFVLKDHVLGFMHLDSPCTSPPFPPTNTRWHGSQQRERFTQTMAEAGKSQLWPFLLPATSQFNTALSHIFSFFSLRDKVLFLLLYKSCPPQRRWTGDLTGSVSKGHSPSQTPLPHVFWSEMITHGSPWHAVIILFLVVPTRISVNAPGCHTTLLFMLKATICPAEKRTFQPMLPTRMARTQLLVPLLPPMLKWDFRARHRWATRWSAQLGPVNIKWSGWIMGEGGVCTHRRGSWAEWKQLPQWVQISPQDNWDYRL